MACTHRKMRMVLRWRMPVRQMCRSRPLPRSMLSGPTPSRGIGARRGRCRCLSTPTRRSPTSAMMSKRKAWGLARAQAAQAVRDRLLPHPSNVDDA